MSILQLAINDTVYIVDLFVLYVTQDAQDALKNFFTIFFTSKHIIKIGKSFNKCIGGAFRMVCDYGIPQVSHLSQ